jgi:integrase
MNPITGSAGCWWRKAAGRLVRHGDTIGPIRSAGYQVSARCRRGDELRALRRLQRESQESPFLFVSERGAFQPRERASKAAGLAFKAHLHMLRHACGYALANAGHDTRSLQVYLGHRNIQHTVRYTELAPTRFKDFWR